MSDFTTYRLGDIGKIVTGKTPPTNNEENFGNEYMFLGPVDLHKHFIIYESEKMISEKGLQSIKGSILDDFSILIGCIGWDMGNVSLVHKKCATNQQINSITNIKKIFNPYYIYYWLKCKKSFLFQQSNVTRTPILNKTDLSNLTINIPNKDIQNKVANLLTSLDKKIELNNKINKELESMAKILYDYWFVQFDFPDVNGKPYKSSGGKMVYNKDLKRDIPEGWEVCRLEDIEDNIITGKTPPKINPEYFDGDIPFITIGDIRGNMHITSTEETLSKLGADYQSTKYINKGALCVSCIASPGLIGFATKLSQTNQQINSIESRKEENSFYLYFALNDFFNASKAKTGNTFPNMNKGDFADIKLIKPNEQVLLSFSKKIKSSIEQIYINSEQNQELAKLRDWLLPMLMNGQVRVK